MLGQNPVVNIVAINSITVWIFLLLLRYVSILTKQEIVQETINIVDRTRTRMCKAQLY
jgi:hypothetical protein